MANMKQHKLGWIGIGRMGYAMAERLAKFGLHIAVVETVRARKRSRSHNQARRS